MTTDWGGDDRDKSCFEGKNGALGDLLNIKEEEGEVKSKNDSKFWA